MGLEHGDEEGAIGRFHSQALEEIDRGLVRVFVRPIVGEKPNRSFALLVVPSFVCGDLEG